MKEKRIFDAIGEVDDALVEEARRTKLGRYAHRWRRWAAVAACAVAAVGIGGALLLSGRVFPGGNTGGGGHEEGSATFMSYAGPVFPLALLEDSGGLTAGRSMDFDFSPYHTRRESYTLDNGEIKTYERYDSRVLVTDAYTLTNNAGEDRTVTAVYPFAGSLSSDGAVMPSITADGAAADAALFAGPYSGSFMGAIGGGGESLNLAHLHSWEAYKALLEDGGYLARALDEFPTLGQHATVYKFTDPVADHEAAPAATLNVDFIMDYDKTTILTYGFNGGSRNEETGYRAYSYFVPESFNPDYGMPRYLIVLGEDIGEYTLQGYRDGGCDPGEEMDGITAGVVRYETTLDEALREIMDWDRGLYGGEHDGRIEDMVSREMYFGLVAELLYDYGVLSRDVKERYDAGMLEDMLSEARSMDRVFYLTFELTVPAGGSVTVTASMIKENSYDFYGGNTGVHGYDMVTRLGSGLRFTRQTASIQDHGLIELVRQNFGFDLEGGVRSVELDPGAEHYYLEIRRVGT